MSADDKMKSTMVHSFQECMAKGGRIVKCQPNAYATNHYAVRVRMPNDFEKFFPNVIEEHVKPFLDGDNLPSAQSGNAAKQDQELSSEGENESSEKSGLRTNFLNAMHNGGVIIEYHKNKRGNYT
ncbi:3698_t:CDS:1, partial [Acaulospora morrowiae]